VSCCPSPPAIGSPTLTWTSRIAEMNKIGYSPYTFTDPAAAPSPVLKRYLKRTRIVSATSSGSKTLNQNYGWDGCVQVIEASASITGAITTVEEYDISGLPPWASPTTGTSGSITTSESSVGTGSPSEPPGESSSEYCIAEYSYPNPYTDVTVTSATMPPLSVVSATRKTGSQTNTNATNGIPLTLDGEEELSEEFTTADLIAKVEELLLTKVSGWTAGSFRSLSENETTLSASNSEWKIEHSPTASCYLRVWLRSKFTPTEGEVVYTDLDPYVWSGSGNPCLINPLLSVSDDANVIHGGANDLPIPQENGTEIVEVMKWSYLPDYEPDISDPSNNQPNGFPDSTWEAAAP